MTEFNSSLYWENRYKNGGNSGVDSYNKLALYKANIINLVIKNNNEDIKTIIDYGVGDGNQLSLIDIENKKYVGLDVSEFIINKLSEIYKSDKNKEFSLCNSIDFSKLKGELVISCNVLYHLIEEEIYTDYLNNLFNMSERFVIIYANNINKTETEHVKFRKFTDYIRKNFKEWILIRHLPNPYNKTSPNEFYIYEKNGIINNWKKYINENLLKITGDKPEGNIYMSHKTNKEELLMIPKQKNIVTLLKLLRPNNVLEIGFNGGFSALLMKMTCPEINLTCIDINYHNYVIPCFNKISSDYPGMEIMLESSQTGLKKLINKNLVYDVIHIDGDHSLKGATEDLKLCLKLSRKGTIIIFDDTNILYLHKLCDIYINSGHLREFKFNKIEGTKYNHRFLEVII